MYASGLLRRENCHLIPESSPCVLLVKLRARQMACSALLPNLLNIFGEHLFCLSLRLSTRVVVGNEERGRDNG